MKDPNSWSEMIPGLEQKITSIKLNENQVVFTTNNGLFEYETDGLIFTSANLGVGQ